MPEITLTEIARNPDDFIRRMEDGEMMIVVEGARTVAEVKPVRREPQSELRPYGLAAGQFVVPDDFNEPLPEDILQEFEGR